MHMFLRFGDNVQERFVVKVLVKNWQPSIASVEDMIEIAAQRCSPRPAHGVDNNQPTEASQEKKGPDTFSGVQLLLGWVFVASRGRLIGQVEVCTLSSPSGVEPCLRIL